MTDVHLCAACGNYRDTPQHALGCKALSSHCGPTDTDPDPGKLWCYDCGGEVYGFEEGEICSGCDRESGTEEERS